ncbi:MAG: sugar phosphorylase [Gammaproteobacteria bacterium]|nr:sugar phosphorylase [Gammaproteobacteria bacterium]
MTDENKLPYAFYSVAEARLERLYGPEQTPEVMKMLSDLINDYCSSDDAPKPQEKWTEKDTILITYGGSIFDKAETHHLKTLHKFLSQYLRGVVNTVHILPFFPFSSDDGFSVIDYLTVDPALGDWEDIHALCTEFNLMIDFVVNHISRESLWFVEYLNNKSPGRDFFIEVSPDEDLSKVVRPRPHDLAVPVHTHRGLKHLWATFSEDQIDLNFRNPVVLLTFIKIMLEYIRHGARFIRLDAIAFLWKQIGTSCIHLSGTHEVVKLFRDIVDLVAPEVVLITETNVPNGENISYFGNSDEAHMVYQFSLPPMLLHALFRGDAEHLTQWALDYPRPPKGCTYLNFTASHDGIGLRPLEGILAEEEIDNLVSSMRQYGGYVSMRKAADGHEVPYEINITYFDALKGTALGIDQWQTPRFICSQTVCLSIQGIPALYIHSLLATPNDTHGVEQTGRTRSINRSSLDYEEVTSLLESPEIPHAIVFSELKRRIKIRGKQIAFHPESDQKTIDLGHSFFALWRFCDRQKILAIHNVTNQFQTVTLPKERPTHKKVTGWTDLLQDKYYSSRIREISLKPYQSVWLELQESHLRY